VRGPGWVRCEGAEGGVGGEGEKTPDRTLALQATT